MRLIGIFFPFVSYKNLPKLTAVSFLQVRLPSFDLPEANVLIQISSHVDPAPGGPEARASARAKKGLPRALFSTTSLSGACVIAEGELVLLGLGGLYRVDVGGSKARTKAPWHYYFLGVGSEHSDVFHGSCLELS